MAILGSNSEEACYAKRNVTAANLVGRALFLNTRKTPALQAETKLKVFFPNFCLFIYNTQLGYGDNEPVKVEDLCKFDQMHYFGTKAVDEGAAVLGIRYPSVYPVLPV